MIWHQAIGDYIEMWKKTGSNFFDENDVVIMAIKKYFFIVSLIVNMVNIFRNKFHG